MIRAAFKRWLFREDETANSLDVYSFVEGSPIRHETLLKIQRRWLDEGLIR